MECPLWDFSLFNFTQSNYRGALVPLLQSHDGLIYQMAHRPYSSVQDDEEFALGLESHTLQMQG